MNKYLYPIIIAVLLVTACNRDYKTNEEYKKQDKIANVVYPGHDIGCKTFYDELFCPKKYDKTALNSGKRVFKVVNGILLQVLPKQVKDGDIVWVKVERVWNEENNTK